jgi:DNA anti-recombination protein RmuC
MDYAHKKSVAMTSPNQFTYFVKTLMMAHRQSELSKHAVEILRALGGIQVEAEKFDAELEVLDGHVSRTTKSMDNVKSKFGKLFGKIEAVQALGESEVAQPPLLED